MTKKVLLVGLGLIGGSLALAIKEEHPEYEISAIDRNEKSLETALELGIIDKTLSNDNLINHASDFDYIILALPVQYSIDFLEELSRYDLKEGLLLTDASSTKAEIVARAEELFKDKNVRFVGGHPMAGSHKSGVLAANINLFENAYYVLAPSSISSPEDLLEVKELLIGTRAQFIELDAHEHDKVTSQLSHFPHILAALLVEQASDYAKIHPATGFLAAGGFRDMTRIASSDANMWTDIIMTNQKQLVDRLDDFTEYIQGIKQEIIDGDSQKIFSFFDDAREKRDSMQIHNGAIPSFYDLYVNVPDKVGVIHEILGYLNEAGISIINIRIIENREEIMGGLKLSFRSGKDQHDAQEIIEKKTGYKVYEA